MYVRKRRSSARSDWPELERCWSRCWGCRCVPWLMGAEPRGDQQRRRSIQLVQEQVPGAHGEVACMNTPVRTSDEASGLDRAWSDALQLLDDDLLRRDAAQRTRRAYGIDLAQFARWAAARGLTPRAVGPREVRRYVALLSEANAAASTTARKLASLRALFASQREHGLIAQNPADLVSTPRRSSYLPRVLKAKEAAKLLDSIGARGRAGNRSRRAGWVGHSFNATARCSSSPIRAGCAPRSSYRFGSQTSITTTSSCASREGTQDSLSAGRRGRDGGGEALLGARP